MWTNLSTQTHICLYTHWLTAGDALCLQAALVAPPLTLCSFQRTQSPLRNHTKTIDDEGAFWNHPGVVDLQQGLGPDWLWHWIECARLDPPTLTTYVFRHQPMLPWLCQSMHVERTLVLEDVKVVPESPFPPSITHLHMRRGVSVHTRCSLPSITTLTIDEGVYFRDLQMFPNVHTVHDLCGWMYLHYPLSLRQLYWTNNRHSVMSANCWTNSPLPPLEVLHLDIPTHRRFWIEGVNTWATTLKTLHMTISWPFFTFPFPQLEELAILDDPTIHYYDQYFIHLPALRKLILTDVGRLPTQPAVFPSTLEVLEIRDAQYPWWAKVPCQIICTY